MPMRTDFVDESDPNHNPVTDPTINAAYLNSLSASMNSTNENIGTGTDSSTAATLFGRIRQLLEVLGLKTDPNATSVNNTYTAMSYLKGIFATVSSIYTYLTNTIKPLIDTISAYVLRGQIKSIQSGTINGYPSTDIRISAVNPAKCFVLINGGITSQISYSGSGGGADIPQGNTVSAPHFRFLTETELGITGSRVGDVSGTVSWQLIEFY